MDRIGTRTEIEIKIRIEINTEDKKSGKTVTTTREVETAVGDTISAEASYKTQGTRRDGITNPHSPNRYDSNQTGDNQTCNNHTRRIDNSRSRTDTEAKGAVEDEEDPEGNKGLIITDSKIIDSEAKGDRDTIKDSPPQPQQVKSQTTTQTGRREQGSK